MKKSKIATIFGVGLVVIALFSYGVFIWFFCRFYVPAGHMAVVTAKTGSVADSETILVERGQKGIWREVLAEGRHFLNPLIYDVEIIPAVEIPLGKVGIVTSKVGKELPSGSIIAENAEYKGVWRDALGPGTYRLNPQGYSIQIINAVNIPVGYVGVVTSQTGDNSAKNKFAKIGEKGVLKDILQPGLYYINPYAYQVNIFEVGMNQVTMSAEDNVSVMESRNRLLNSNSALLDMEKDTIILQENKRQKVALKSTANSSNNMLLKSDTIPANATPVPNAVAIFGLSQAVEFPSRDGFKVVLEMTVEFELMPDTISKIYLLYGDLPDVVNKIILPQVLSVSRMKGSSYQAQDFIMGEGREKFQYDLRDDLSRVLATKNIIVHNAIIRNVAIPQDILSPIRLVSIAKEQNLTNISMQDSAKKLAELNIELELIKQKIREVNQDTEKIVAQIKSEKSKEVAQIGAETKLKVAELLLKKSSIEAEIIKVKGEAEVKATFIVNSAKAQGEQLRAKELGEAGLLADIALVESLSNSVESRIIYAGEGTLWTDLKSATLPLPATK